MKSTTERRCTHHTNAGRPCWHWALHQNERFARMTAQPDARFIGEEEADNEPDPAVRP